MHEIWVISITVQFSVTYGPLHAQITVGSSSSPQTNTSINPSGLSNNDVIIFADNIILSGTDAIDITPVPSNLTITINSGVTIQTGGTSEVLDINSSFNGTINIMGSLVTTGTDDALDIDGDLNGMVTITSTGMSLSIDKSEHWVATFGYQGAYVTGGLRYEYQYIFAQVLLMR